MRVSLVAVLLAASGCSSSATGDSLVVVSVDSAAPLDQVALLHATATAGGRSIDRDVGPESDASTFAIPPRKSFGVQLSPSIAGLFSIHVEARDAGGVTLAAGDGQITLQPGKRVDLTVVLGAPAADLSSSDGGSLDGGSLDGGSLDGGATDLAQPIQVFSEPIWIGSGGSASSATQQLNLRVGGFDTSGVANAPSGARFTSGFFATQTN